MLQLVGVGFRSLAVEISYVNKQAGRHKQIQERDLLARDQRNSHMANRNATASG